MNYRYFNANKARALLKKQEKQIWAQTTNQIETNLYQRIWNEIPFQVNHQIWSQIRYTEHQATNKSIITSKG